jgi:hypothetical protein
MRDPTGDCFDILALMATWVQEIGDAELQREFEGRAAKVLKELDDPRARMALEDSGRG